MLHVGLDRFSLVLGWVAVVLMLVADGARRLGLVFCAAGSGIDFPW